MVAWILGGAEMLWSNGLGCCVVMGRAPFLITKFPWFAWVAEEWLHGFGVWLGCWVWGGVGMWWSNGLGCCVVMGRALFFNQ